MKTVTVYGYAAFTAVLAVLTAQAAPSFTQKDISQVGWSVAFAGSQYNAASDTTTFSYSLTALASEKDLSHWVIGLCTEQVPTGSGSLTKIGLDPTTGVSGFKWDDGQSAGSTATYSIVLAGYYGEAETEYAVKGGTYYAIGKIMGPTCSPINRVNTYSISGTAFVDANLNGVWDSGEALLANVSINLADASGNFLATVMTDAQGHYSFTALVAGTYYVGIPSLTTDILEDFNETLAVYFTATTPTPISVGLTSSDSQGNNFGFAINAASILADLQAGDADGDGFTMAGTGKTIGFWKHQNTVALTGKGRAQIDATTLKGYLASVQALFLPVPFQFAAGKEYADALAILSSTSSNPVDLLKKQLLGTELNEVAGLGLSGTVNGMNLDQLQTVIIAWAEFLVANSTSYTTSQLLEAKDICDYINNTGE